MNITDLTASEQEAGSDTIDLFLTNIEYRDEESQPLVHIWGRDSDGTLHERHVYGHRPNFHVADIDVDGYENHYAVHDISDGRESLDGEQLTRIETKLPKHVPELKDMLGETWEADVFYTTRWLIDNDVWTGITVPDNRTRVSVDDIQPCDPPSPVDPRVLTADIEVASEGGFPDPQDADWPVSTIVAHDSYTDEYVGWLLLHESHGSEVTSESSVRDAAELDDYRYFTDEQRLLNDFNEYVSTVRPDIMTGWFSNDFDYPYLINRCRELSVWSYQDWSPMGDVWVTKSRQEPAVKGVTMLDMLDAYEKTQIHKLQSRTLDAIAEAELDESKIEVDESHTAMWKNDPVTFLEYNQRDVRLVVDIEQSGDIVAMFNQLREVTGAQYENCMAAIDMLDPMFLREAKERGYALPTATKPDRSWFYGGYVFEPEAGLHEHVIYFDVASMYPYILSMLNISPETLVGYEQTGATQPHSFVDGRPDNIKKDSDPEGEPFYYEDPNTKSGFVSTIVENILELTETTSGKRREALKRSRNAIWGVLGDGDSYGKGFRLFDWRMGESVTLAGRRIIQWTADEIVEYLHDIGYDDARVVIGDTDGIGVCVPSCDDAEHAERIGYDVETYINGAYDDAMEEMFNAESQMEIEAESYASTLFTTGTKKRYAQQLEWER